LVVAQFKSASLCIQVPDQLRISRHFNQVKSQTPRWLKIHDLLSEFRSSAELAGPVCSRKISCIRRFHRVRQPDPEQPKVWPFWNGSERQHMGPHLFGCRIYAEFIRYD
jgi:hypothetical protein